MNHLDNGLIDVAPHGQYIEMVNTNATLSPLLRLPAELRKKIWHEALNGYTIEPIDRRAPGKATNVVPNTQHFRKVMVGTPKAHHFALLRVSRHTYVETAILLYELSAFAIKDAESISLIVRAMPHWQVALMRNVRKFSMNTSGPALTAFFRDHFPMLEEVEIHAQVVPPNTEADELIAWLLELGVAVEIKKCSYMRKWSALQWRRHEREQLARSNSLAWRNGF